jgi:hypothetical protein
MTARRFAIMMIVSSTALAHVAGAVPHHAAPPPPWLTPGKPTKKQLEIEKHQVVAQYLLMRADDADGAAKEYQAILVLDPQDVRSALALASLY